MVGVLDNTNLVSKNVGVVDSEDWQKIIGVVVGFDILKKVLEIKIKDNRSSNDNSLIDNISLVGILVKSTNKTNNNIKKISSRIDS